MIPMELQMESKKIIDLQSIEIPSLNLEKSYNKDVLMEFINDTLLEVLDTCMSTPPGLKIEYQEALLSLYDISLWYGWDTLLNHIEMCLMSSIVYKEKYHKDIPLNFKCKEFLSVDDDAWVTKKPANDTFPIGRYLYFFFTRYQESLRKAVLGEYNEDFQEMLEEGFTISVLLQYTLEKMNPDINEQGFCLYVDRLLLLK